jgi:hypothetical protein
MQLSSCTTRWVHRQVQRDRCCAGITQQGCWHHSAGHNLPTEAAAVCSAMCTVWSPPHPTHTHTHTCANFSHLVSGLGLGSGFSRGSAVLGAGSCASRPPCTASLGSANSWLTRACVTAVATCRHVALRSRGVKCSGLRGLGSKADMLPRSNSRWPEASDLQWCICRIGCKQGRVVVVLEAECVKLHVDRGCPCAGAVPASGHVASTMCGGVRLLLWEQLHCSLTHV